MRNGQLNPKSTPRHLAMLMGTLGYIARSGDIKHVFYNLHRNLAVLSYATWVYPQGWDIPLPQLTYMFAEIPNLYEMVKTKRTSNIYPEQQPHANTLICITDASHIGWGGIVCSPSASSWNIEVKAGWWPKVNDQLDPLYESSVIAEPKAVSQTLKSLEIPSSIKHVIIVVDHSPLVSAGRSSQARRSTHKLYPPLVL